ncbi:MAG: undecaprenyldiphospho-muramoylpentapeptide beta-N-acetylglucosaminyltransferase [bacterium]
MKRVLVVAGGTGGHIFPVLALAHELVSRGLKVFWAGRPEGMEMEVVIKEGYEFEPVSAGQISGKSLGGKLAGIAFLTGGFFKSMAVLRKIQPDAIIAGGGFVSAPVLLAARLERRQFFLLDQNRIPGRVTRFFARHARESFLTFPPEKPFPGRFSITGAPLREGIVCGQRRDDGKTVLIIGGSQGARILNFAALDVAAALSNFHFIILTGRRDYRTVKSLVRSANCELVEWSDHPEELYQRATIAVSRAGGMVINELLTFGIPTILIPFPEAADRHQEANARYVASQGAAVMLEQNQISGLTILVRTLMADEHRRQEMENCARGLARPQAAKEIAERIEQCLVN